MAQLLNTFYSHKLGKGSHYRNVIVATWYPFFRSFYRNRRRKAIVEREMLH